MIFDSILFSLFVFFITIIGVGFCAVASRSTGLHVVNFPSFAFPLFGIFSIGFLSLIINFFTGVGSIGFYVALTPFFIIGLFNFRKIDIEFFKILTIVTILLTPVAYVTNPGYDGGLYHLPHQKWIRDEAIVLGLANLHGRFGFSSLLEYVNAPLWIAENFKLLPYVSGAFLVSFIVFTFQSINSQAPVIRILTVLISVSLIVFNKFIPLNYTSTDSPGGWLFCMTVVIGAGLITHMNPFGLPTSGATAKANYLGLLFVFLLFSMFSFSIKGSNILIFLWGAIVVIQLLRMGLIKPLQLAKISIIPLFFLFLFLLRGVLTTGCIVYPASWSCLDVVWSAEANAINDSNWITAWARHPRTGLSSLESWSWIQDYWIGANSAFLIWFGISAATVFSVTALAKKQLQFERRHKQEIAAGILAIFLALMLWFVKAPNPRFGLGPLLLIVPFFAVFIFGVPLKYSRRFWKKISICLVALLILRFDLQVGFSLENLTNFNLISVRSTEVIADKNFGVRPIKGDQCWLEAQCAPYDRPASDEVMGYRIFK